MMVRRLFLIGVLILVTERPWLQSQLLLVAAFANLGFLSAVGPYKDKLTNIIEIVNEITVYTSALLHIQFNQESNDLEKI